MHGCHHLLQRSAAIRVPAIAENIAHTIRQPHQVKIGVRLPKPVRRRRLDLFEQQRNRRGLFRVRALGENVRGKVAIELATDRHHRRRERQREHRQHQIDAPLKRQQAQQRRNGHAETEQQGGRRHHRQRRYAARQHAERDAQQHQLTGWPDIGEEESKACAPKQATRAGVKADAAQGSLRDGADILDVARPGSRQKSEPGDAKDKQRPSAEGHGIDLIPDHCGDQHRIGDVDRHHHGQLVKNVPRLLKPQHGFVITIVDQKRRQKPDSRIRQIFLQSRRTGPGTRDALGDNHHGGQADQGQQRQPGKSGDRAKGDRMTGRDALRHADKHNHSNHHRAGSGGESCGNRAQRFGFADPLITTESHACCLWCRP